MLQKNKKFKIDQSDWSNLHTSTWQVLALTSDKAMWQIVENNCPYMTDFYVRHHPHLILGFVDLSGYTLSGQATKMFYAIMFHLKDQVLDTQVWIIPHFILSMLILNSHL